MSTVAHLDCRGRECDDGKRRGRFLSLSRERVLGISFATISMHVQFSSERNNEKRNEEVARRHGTNVTMPYVALAKFTSRTARTPPLIYGMREYQARSEGWNVLSDRPRNPPSPFKMVKIGSPEATELVRVANTNRNRNDWSEPVLAICWRSWCWVGVDAQGILRNRVAHFENLVELEGHYRKHASDFTVRGEIDYELKASAFLITPIDP